jgi:hypothetical protein
VDRIALRSPWSQQNIAAMAEKTHAEGHWAVWMTLDASQCLQAPNCDEKRRAMMLGSRMGHWHRINEIFKQKHDTHCMFSCSTSFLF